MALPETAGLMRPRHSRATAADSEGEHEIRVWIRDPEAGLGSVRSEIFNRLWRLFKDNGIGIPYPQRDVHLKDWPKAPAAGGEG